MDRRRLQPGARLPVTLDAIVKVISNSIFHPWIVFVAILCVYATHRHKLHRTFVTYLFIWLWVLCAGYWLVGLNHRICYGRPRKVVWRTIPIEDESTSGRENEASVNEKGGEVAVITGGASGLGRFLVETLLARGAKVAVLDIVPPDVEMREKWMGGEEWEVLEEDEGDVEKDRTPDESGNLRWYLCDVGNAEAVKKIAERLREEVGPPTILINNAATSINSSALIPIRGANDASDVKPNTLLSDAQVHRTLAVNQHSHFYTLAAFLPLLFSCPQGATIVTISSILAHLSPASLSDYVASKAAVSSLHHSLSHEIALVPGLKHKVKTILVETGHMATPLFAHAQMPWYAAFLGPTLEVPEVAREIVKAIGKGESAVIRMPLYASLVGSFYAALPGSLQMGVRRLGGVDTAF